MMKEFAEKQNLLVDKTNASCPPADFTYICKHIMRSIHAPIRQYQTDTRQLEVYYGTSQKEDMVTNDIAFEEELLNAGNEDHPILYDKDYPIYYAVVKSLRYSFVIGPVNVEPHEGTKGKRLKISFCEYEKFCEEVLLLFYTLTGKQLTCSELNEKNYVSQELQERMNKVAEHLIFEYQESSRKHNPYDREMREMESIRRGNVEGLIQSLDEVFEGEYAVLSRNKLQSAKNLAIVGLALSARAAINGGMEYEVAFSINDSYILAVDRSSNIGEVESLVRQAKIEYAERIRGLFDIQDRNHIVDECKNLIFQRMHSKIDVRELAEQLQVTPEYLSALFKKTEHIRISDYILKEKIKRAENLLIYSEYTFEQIGLYLGFCSQSHFGSTFKKYTGLTPRQYRLKYLNEDYWAKL